MSRPIVNSRTKLFAIIGDPITHCMSPVIMNSSFKRLGLDNVFVAMRCEPVNIDVVMRALRAIDLQGYIVTMPLKEIVAPYVDEIRGEARLSGAINCIQNNGGRLIGYNTDSMGFWAAIQEKNIRSEAIPIRKLFILGMGGLAKAVATQAAMQGVSQIVAVNRMEEPLFIERFQAFVDRLCAEFPGVKVTLLPWEPDSWVPELADTDVVMNVTPIGLEAKGSLRAEFPYGSVKKQCIFFDSPVLVGTEFLQEAALRGHTTIDGIDLNVHQGVFAFNIMTGLTVKSEDLRMDALDFLGLSGG